MAGAEAGLDGGERGGSDEEEVTEELADDAGDDVAVAAEIGLGAEGEASVVARAADEGGHALGGAEGVVDDRGAALRGEGVELGEDGGGLGEELEVAFVLRGARGVPGGGEAARFGRGGGAEEVGEGGEGREAILAGPDGGVLEGVGDAEEEIRHRDLAAERLGEERYREGEGAAGAGEEPFEIDHEALREVGCRRGAERGSLGEALRPESGRLRFTGIDSWPSSSSNLPK